MKKIGKKDSSLIVQHGLFLFFTLTAITGFSQVPTVFERSATPATEAMPSFTDIARYNSFDFCNSPVGVFDRDSLMLRLSLSSHVVRWHAADNNDSLKRGYTSWNVPDIFIGKPKNFYLRLNYTPVSIADETMLNQKLSLQLQTFGLVLAGQAPSGIFQISFRGKGYVGQEDLSGSRNNRMIMGLDDLSLTLGSRIHELMAIGMSGGATAKADTFRNYGAFQTFDRYFTGQIPVLGWYVDFGKEGFPVASEFSLNTATSRFVYVSGSNTDRDPIKGDSLAWKWQAAGDFSRAGVRYCPAVLLTYWKNHYQLYDPTENNNDLNVGPIQPGRDYTFSDFAFGFGSSARILKYASAWIEYTYSSLGLAYGTAWSNVTDKSQQCHRTSIGVEANIHSLDALRFPQSIETFLRMGYFNQTQNSGINPFEQEDFGLSNPVLANTQLYRYIPAFSWGMFERVSGLVLGLGATFLDKRIVADTHVAFLSKNDNSGMDFGIDAAYMLR